MNRGTDADLHDQKNRPIHSKKIRYLNDNGFCFVDDAAHQRIDQAGLLAMVGSIFPDLSLPQFMRNSRTGEATKIEL